MAIDTAEKRQSFFSHGMPWVGQDFEDRMIDIAFYPGNALTDIVPTTPIPVGTPQATLVSILSGVPLPKIPVVDPELDSYLRNLHNYLRRLRGSFTDENVFASGAMNSDEVDQFIESITTKVYTLVESTQYIQTLVSLTHVVSAGTGSFTVTADGTTITGSGSSSLSSTQGVFTFNANQIGTGVQININVTDDGGLADLSVTLKRDRLIGVAQTGVTLL
jgi:hypothetical protein